MENPPSFARIFAVLDKRFVSVAPQISMLLRFDCKYLISVFLRNLCNSVKNCSVFKVCSYYNIKNALCHAFFEKFV